MSKVVNKVTFSIIWRSALLWTIVGLVAIPYNLIAITMVLLPVKIRHKVISSWARIFTYFSVHLCKIKYDVIGIENLVSGSAIIASNHQSMWETVVFAKIFPQHVWILKRELLKVPFFGWTIATLSPIAIDRSQGSAAIQQILSQSISRIKNGFWILAFPEGTRVAPGTKKPYKIGVARMASALKLPIIPVAHNAGYALPKGSRLFYPGKVTVIIDKPIYPKDDESPEDLILKIEDTITKNLATITR